MKSYLIKSIILTAIFILALVLITAGQIGAHWQNIAGVVFLFVLFYVVHGFSNKQGSNPNKQIRITMIASMLRMFIAIAFFVTLLYNAKKSDANFDIENYKIFIFSYVLYFLFALVLDIIEMRSKLRTLLEEKNKNANI